MFLCWAWLIRLKLGPMYIDVLCLSLARVFPELVPSRSLGPMPKFGACSECGKYLREDFTCNGPQCASYRPSRRGRRCIFHLHRSVFVSLPFIIFWIYLALFCYVHMKKKLWTRGCIFEWKRIWGHHHGFHGNMWLWAGGHHHVYLKEIWCVLIRFLM